MGWTTVPADEEELVPEEEEEALVLVLELRFLTPNHRMR